MWLKRMKHWCKPSIFNDSNNKLVTHSNETHYIFLLYICHRLCKESKERKKNKCTISTPKYHFIVSIFNRIALIVGKVQRNQVKKKIETKKKNESNAFFSPITFRMECWWDTLIFCCCSSLKFHIRFYLEWAAKKRGINIHTDTEFGKSISCTSDVPYQMMTIIATCSMG